MRKLILCHHGLVNRKGFAHIFLLSAGLAVIIFIVAAGYLPFKDNLYQVLYRKSESKAAENQTEFYISPSGLDTNDGTINAPFKTLDKAKSAVRQVNRSGNRITVWLRAGVYELSSPFVLEPDDSGFNNQYVVYQGYPGETAVISGGKRITGWTQEGDKWKAPSGGINTRQLYVNGARAVRARSAGIPPGAQVNTTADFKTSGFSITDLNYQNFKNKTDMEISLMSVWRQFKCPVVGITGGNVSMGPCWQASQWYWEATKDPFYLIKPDWIENAYELLDQPGEWYLDKTTQTFYYKPKAGENIASAYIVAPILENLVTGKGTPDNPLHNVAFQDIRFEYSTWMEPSLKGYVGGQSSHYLKYDNGVHTGYGLTPAAMTFETAKNMSIVQNVFQHLGGAGIYFGFASQENLLYANHLTDLSGDGIILGDFDPYKNANGIPANQITRGNQIGNNYIHDIGVEYQGANGMHVFYAQDTQIAHNEIAHVPYDGIAVNTFPAREDLTISKNNRIANNLIYDHMRVGMDGGGIYVNSNQPGSIVAENVIHSQHHRAGNLYIDDQGTNWTFVRNVVYNVLTPDLVEFYKNPPLNYGRTFSGKGCNHTIRDNYWQLKRNPEDFFLYSVTSTKPDCASTNNVGNNTVITDPSQAPQDIIANAGIQTEYKKIKNINLTPPIVTLSAPAQISLSATNASFSWNFLFGADGFERVNPYEVGAPDSQPLGSVYLSCTPQPSAPIFSGRCQIPNLFTNPAKKYEYRMFAKDGVTVIARSNQIAVIPDSPPPSPSLSPSPVVSPSPAKPGDTDGDNDVDIFDFNQVITDFGKKNDPSTKADLDNDDDVDIFDFNIVVTNFGK